MRLRLASTITLLCVLFSFSFFSTTLAQDDERIEYGQTVTGEINNRDFEIPYVFTASAEDVIVVAMKPVDRLGDLDSPSVILLDPDFNVVGSTYSFGDVVFAAVIPDDGDYTILATRNDGRAGESVGEYTLTLMNPPDLQPDMPVSDELDNETSKYYVVRDYEDFVLNYQKDSGDFSPAITINVIDDNSLNDVAIISGDLVSGGSLRISEDDIYIISIGEALFDFNFQTVEAEYTLTLTLPE